MYKTVNGKWTNDDYSRSETVWLYPETLEVTEGYRGRNFSERLMRDFAKDIRAMADVTEKYADIPENPNSTDKEKAEAHKRYLETFAILDI